MKTFTQETETQDWAYGPQHCRQLAAGDAKSSSGMKLSGEKTLSNADSYAWFANVSTSLQKISFQIPRRHEACFVQIDLPFSTFADSFVFRKQEVYWTITCNRPFGDPTDNSYTPAGVSPDASTEL